MLTMNEMKRNPLIRVYPQTRKKLKIIAAYYEESMLETVERLAQAELERLQQGGQKDIPRETGQYRPNRSTR